MNSFDSGAIFQSGLSQKLSRNAFVVWILFPGRIAYWRKGSRMHPENEDFREFFSFVESVRGASRRLLERIGMLESASRMFGKVRSCV